MLSMPRRNGVAVDLQGLHESLSDVGYEGIEPYPLRAYPMACVLAVFTAAARGETDIDPVGSPIAMSGKAGGVDQGLGQEGLNAVSGGPVGDDLPQGARQHMAREIGNMHMGQDQEAGVADDRLQVLSAGSVVPANPLIASLKAPGRRGELQAAQDHGMRGCRLDQVAEMGPKGHAMAESMVTRDEGAPQRPLFGCGDALPSDRLQGGKRGVGHRRLRVWTHQNPSTTASRAAGLQRGQCYQPRLLHPFEQGPTFDRLRLSVGAAPVEEFAHRLCQLMAAKPYPPPPSPRPEMASTDCGTDSSTVLRLLLIDNHCHIESC